VPGSTERRADHSTDVPLMASQEDTHSRSLYGLPARVARTSRAARATAVVASTLVTLATCRR
jgi:hypothetical protein